MAKRSHKEIEKIGQRYRAMPARLAQSEVASQLDVPLSTLRGYIEKYGWERDLAPEVQRRTTQAVIKAALGADLDRPLTNEETAIQERVALNVALITAHQEWLSGFGESLNNLLEHHVAQSKDLAVAIEDKDNPGAFRLVRKNLGPSIGEARQLISAFSEFAEQQRKAHGIDSEGDGNSTDVDSYLRELAAEMQDEQDAALAGDKTSPEE